MNELVALIAAVVGSSGIASVVASGTQYRRTHRLHTQLKELDASCKLVEPGTVEAIALAASRANVALELASYIFIKRNSRLLTALWMSFALTLAAAFIQNALEATPLVPLPIPQGEGAIPRIVMLLVGLILILIVQVWLMVATILGYTAHKRRRFIKELLREPKAEMSPTKFLSIAQTPRPFRETLLHFANDLFRSR